MMKSLMVFAAVLTMACGGAQANEGNNLASVERSAGTGVYHTSTFSPRVATGQQAGPQGVGTVEVAAAPDRPKTQGPAGR